MKPRREELETLITRWMSQFHYQPYSIQTLIDMIWKYYPPIHSIGTTGYRNAIRLRQVMSRQGDSDVWIACKAEESSPKDGDIYLNGDQYDAVSALFRQENKMHSRDIEREVLREREKTQGNLNERD